MAKYLTGDAKRQFDSYNSLGASRLRGFSSYPEDVQLLLKTFATEEIIIAAVAKFEAFRGVRRRMSGPSGSESATQHDCVGTCSPRTN